jgi:hypothetical protein
MKATTNIPDKPTTVRLPYDLIEKLDKIRLATKVSRSALIALSITSFVAYVGRTGKLPADCLKNDSTGGYVAGS